ncbi:MAG TPA: neutral/alkaline non-lysosomal ceramidase N-terminal domain-containing protein [Bryobacteraceae bacterium]|nr:neutral/alkaline non-lysosomal ceramidase N-terminal domain-containing protein [Bryobacteraceae bacterium]
MKLPIRYRTSLFAAFFICSSGFGAVAERGHLRAGAARVDITPPVNPEYPPSGKYEHEHLYVRAIVLDNGLSRAALLNADFGNMPEDVWTNASKQLAEELKCPVENIIMSATHTHSGVAAGPPPAGPPPPPPSARLVTAMLDAVRQAKTKLQPVLVGFGTGFSYLNANRDVVSDETHRWTQAPNLNAASDKTVAVVSFTTPAGDPVAAYVNYAMHAINGYLVGITSADFPGAASRYVEQAFDDKMVMVFTQGASGDQNPLYMRPGTNALASKSGVRITGYELVRENVEGPLREGQVPHGKLDPKVADRFERWIESEGQLLGEEVIRVMTNIRTRSGDVSIWGAQETISCPGRQRTSTGREGEPGIYKDSDPVNIRLGMVGIGDIALTTVNAEIYTMISQRMKQHSAMANTVLVTLANGRANSGYIPDDASFGHNTFQVLGSWLKPGCAEQGIANGLDDLVAKYVAR